MQKRMQTHSRPNQQMNRQQMYRQMYREIYRQMNPQMSQSTQSPAIPRIAPPERGSWARFWCFLIESYLPNHSVLPTLYTCRHAWSFRSCRIVSLRPRHLVKAAICIYSLPSPIAAFSAWSSTASVAKAHISILLPFHAQRSNSRFYAGPICP
ncbi:predicted protein [Clavispora lusitaniae ATCC 42720]|uniref:Uncharacterized protein n=1 Tax=Clavispora lusitaniae (strain ATCC 42720) TaxID=306902 RepID=C4XY21_CLAL4|nr:uncharacterized protein CLUG_00844 [Clavispora lusitaniae ATCC 42720]EEQ36721.1 predicted protein [Clavispora lusitaniae ATCC 42720]